MKISTTDLVTIHPYFKAKPGKMPEIKPLLAAMVAQTAAEADNYFYDFTIHEDQIFCREGYRGAAGAMAHVTLIGPLIGEMLKLADMTRLELHGAATDLEQLKPMLANLKPVCFVREKT